MNLKQIRENTVMQAIDEQSNTDYRALFSSIYLDDLFYVKSRELYEAVKGAVGVQFRMGFFNGSSICSFTGSTEKVIIRNGAYLTLIRQTSPIAETTQRKTKREELVVPVAVYTLLEKDIQSNRFEQDVSKLALKSVSFDISAGGLCVVCNDRIKASPESCYLVDLSLGKENFLLPARLVRQGNAPQMVNYRHDYGFQFLYDNLPGEEVRLANALISTKVSAVMQG